MAQAGARGRAVLPAQLGDEAAHGFPGVALGLVAVEVQGAVPGAGEIHLAFEGGFIDVQEFPVRLGGEGPGDGGGGAGVGGEVGGQQHPPVGAGGGLLHHQHRAGGQAQGLVHRGAEQHFLEEAFAVGAEDDQVGAQFAGGLGDFRPGPADTQFHLMGRQLGQAGEALLQLLTGAAAGLGLGRLRRLHGEAPGQVQGALGNDVQHRQAGAPLPRQLGGPGQGPVGGGGEIGGDEQMVQGVDGGVHGRFSGAKGGSPAGTCRRQNSSGGRIFAQSGTAPAGAAPNRRRGEGPARADGALASAREWLQ